MCARSNGQLVCVKRRPSRTQAPTVTAAKTNANKRRRPPGERLPEEGWPSGAVVGADVIGRSSALRPATSTPVSARSPKLGRQLVEAREPLLRQLSPLHRRLHRAARLGVVTTVVEAASAG